MDSISTVSDSVYKFIKYSILIAIAFGFTVLFITSILVHDTEYITKHPKFFVSETLVMGVLSSLPILYISYLRGGIKRQSYFEFGLFFMKIALIHIGFQLSGIYSVFFPMSGMRI